MKLRTIKQITYAQEFPMGSFRVKQPLPTHELEQVSPFILLHHAGPHTYQPGAYKARISPHPHRGFEPVTFLFSGKAHHRDSLGNEGFLESGDVQWMTAGSGIIHSEGPSEAFSKEGGVLEMIQLWINLPRAHKMTAPKYQDIPSARIPEISEEGLRIRLVAGQYKDVKGPADTFTPITAMMIHAEAGATFSMPLPAAHHALVYVLDGQLDVQGTEIDALHMGIWNEDGDAISFSVKSKAKLLLLAGEPINEPMSSYGPFVMNYPGEIRQAILDYETGKMGTLDA